MPKKSVKETEGDRQLIQRFGQTMAMVQGGAMQSGLVTQQSVDELLEEVRKLKPGTTSNALRLSAAQFLVFYYTAILMNSTTLEQITQAQARIPKDMMIAWELLDLPSTAEANELMAANLMLMDVAQRMEDESKLHMLYERMRSKEKRSHEESVVLFTTAPMLGLWKDTDTLAVEVMKKEKSLDRFHAMSLGVPVPDYSLVHELITQDGLDKQSNADRTTLSWDFADITRVRIRFAGTVSCGDDEEKAEKIREELMQDQEAQDWQDLPLAELEKERGPPRVKLSGALAQMISFGEAPLQMTGVISGDRVHFRGFTDMPTDASGVDPQELAAMMQGVPPSEKTMTALKQALWVRQSEDYDIKKDAEDPSLYKGIYLMRQETFHPCGNITREVQAEETVAMSFDLEIAFKAPLSSAKPGPSQAPSSSEIVSAIDGLTLD